MKASGRIVTKVTTEENVYWHPSSSSGGDGPGSGLSGWKTLGCLDRERPAAECHVLS